LHAEHVVQTADGFAQQPVSDPQRLYSVGGRRDAVRRVLQLFLRNSDVGRVGGCRCGGVGSGGIRGVPRVSRKTRQSGGLAQHDDVVIDGLQLAAQQETLFDELRLRTAHGHVLDVNDRVEGDSLY